MNPNEVQEESSAQKTNITSVFAALIIFMAIVGLVGFGIAKILSKKN